MKALSLIFFGILALAAGALVYILDRPVGIFADMGKEGAFFSFGAAGDWLPDALHPFAMALICAGTAGGGKKALRFWASFWGLAGLAMEAGQYCGEAVTSWLPAFFNAIPILERTGAYFSNGTFDPMDVMGILLGSVAALAFSFHPGLRDIGNPDRRRPVSGPPSGKARLSCKI